MNHEVASASHLALVSSGYLGIPVNYIGLEKQLSKIIKCMSLLSDSTIIHSTKFIQIIREVFLSTFHVPGTVLGTEDTIMNKMGDDINHVPFYTRLSKLYSLAGQKASQTSLSCCHLTPFLCGCASAGWRVAYLFVNAQSKQGSLAFYLPDVVLGTSEIPDLCLQCYQMSAEIQYSMSCVLCGCCNSLEA